ncbi:MAG: inorganic phosphate transporter [Eubacteriales bacterium]|nr:inorganic phosphate transporter [Eubacteriales bacterium]MDD3883101.1 inorganic phosphate transporter [Eubacteriales bacterium]MDD4513329.1 inorganic phosphate transporter [Eubacteriales bacterium]
MSFAEFISSAQSSPQLVIISLLTLAVILVNGWTDAPNAIATCICTRAIGIRPAILMAAVCNFLGVYVMSSLNASVAMTICNMVNFGQDTGAAITALASAMLAIVIWAYAAWYFGIPTSESHALIAGLTGAAVAISGGFQGVNGAEWVKVLWGLALSTVLGFSSGFITVRLTEAICKNADRRRANRFFAGAQIGGGAAMAFMHGAQGGQKFMAVFMLGAALTKGQANAEVFEIPMWLMAVCSAVMALGTSIGGVRIIKSVGMGMVKLSPHQGFAADTAAALCLLLSSTLGIPVSTTHTKTTAIMGVGASRSLRRVNWSAVWELALTWLLTFPGCGLIGFICAKIALCL